MMMMMNSAAYLVKAPLHPNYSLFTHAMRVQKECACKRNAETRVCISRPACLVRNVFSGVTGLQSAIGEFVYETKRGHWDRNALAVPAPIPAPVVSLRRVKAARMVA